MAGDDRGATMLEYALLLAAVVLPLMLTMMLGAGVIGGWFRQIAVLNAMPLP